MGIEFIQMKGRSFRKDCARAIRQFTEVDLLTSEPEWADHLVLFDIARSENVDIGEQLAVTRTDNCLLAMRQQRVVATAVNPPSDILASLCRPGFEYVLGTVKHYDQLSHTADVVFRTRR